MSLIYEPKGKAREYSPLALNFYKGCDHGCNYCYVPSMMKRFNKNYNHLKVTPRIDFILKLRREVSKYFESKIPVLLSFTSDPYCSSNNKYKITGKALEILLENKIPVSILSKGGFRILQDLSIFKRFGENIQVGTTLTFNNNNDSFKNEPGAASPNERIETLEILKENNITTWVSMEPVIDSKQSIDLIKQSIQFVDKYKIGKLNHNKELEDKIDWHEFLKESVRLMRESSKLFYIKKDLQRYKKDIILHENEINQDYLNIKPFENRRLFD